MDPHVVERLLRLGYGENVELPADELEIPETFQRKLKPRGWDIFVPALFGRISVAEVNSRKFVVDGIHRLHDGRRHGMFTDRNVPSILWRGCTEEDAAALFHLANARRIALRAADEFRAACISGDQDLRDLDTELLNLGLDGWCIGRSNRDLTAIGSVVRLHDQLGIEHTIYSLGIIRDIWEWRDPDDLHYAESSPHVRVVRGFGQYLRPSKRVTGRRYPRRWDRANGPLLTDYLARRYTGQGGLESFLAKAQLKRLGGGGGGGSLGMEMLIHESFLKARRQAQLV